MASSEMKEVIGVWSICLKPARRIESGERWPKDRRVVVKSVGEDEDFGLCFESVEDHEAESGEVGGTGHTLCGICSPLIFDPSG